MIKVCQICGTEYGDHAEYCNVCRQESLVPVETPEPPEERRRLIADAPTLVFVAAIWLLSLGYWLAEIRPRSWMSLFIGWAFISLITKVFCLVMRNLRVAAVMALCALSFFLVYGLVML